MRSPSTSSTSSPGGWCARRRRAPEQRPDAAPELADRERLRDVVVGAELQPEHLVELVVAGGEHHDRHGAACAQALADLEPVQPREHHVEDDEIDGLRVEAGERLVAVPRLDDAVAVPLERIGQELLDRLLVVDEQDGGWIRHEEPTEGARTIARLSPLKRQSAAPGGAGAARPSVPSTAVCTAGRGCSSGCRCSSPPSASSAPPAPLPAPTTPTTQFDGSSALALAQELRACTRTARRDRPGSLGATRWLIDKMRLYSYAPQVDTFEATIPGTGPEAAAERLVHDGPRGRRRDRGDGPPRRLRPRRGRQRQRVRHGRADRARPRRTAGRPGAAAQGSGPKHQLIFLSTDGGAFGGLGAKRFIERFPDPSRIVAVVNLDSIAGEGKPRVEIAGDEPRSPAAGLVETAAARIAEQTGSGPGRTSALGQLTDLGFPFSLYEQAPLVGRGVPGDHADDGRRPAAGVVRRRARSALPTASS